MYVRRPTLLEVRSHQEAGAGRADSGGCAFPAFSGLWRVTMYIVNKSRDSFVMAWFVSCVAGV